MNKLEEFQKNNDYDINQSKTVFNNYRSTNSNMSGSISTICDKIDNFVSDDSSLFGCLKHIHSCHHHHHGHKFDKFGNDKRVFFIENLIKRTKPNNKIYNKIEQKFVRNNNYRDIKILEEQMLGSGKRLLSDLLYKEYLDNCDLDDNKLIYGYDFIIDYDDIDQPISLKYITNNIPNVDKCLGNFISYKEYLNTLKPSDKLNTFNQTVFKDFK